MVTPVVDDDRIETRLERLARHSKTDRLTAENRELKAALKARPQAPAPGPDVAALLKRVERLERRNNDLEQQNNQLARRVSHVDHRPENFVTKDWVNPAELRRDPVDVEMVKTLQQVADLQGQLAADLQRLADRHLTLETYVAQLAVTMGAAPPVADDTDDDVAGVA